MACYSMPVLLRFKCESAQPKPPEGALWLRFFCYELKRLKYMKTFKMLNLIIIQGVIILTIIRHKTPTEECFLEWMTNHPESFHELDERRFYQFANCVFSYNAKSHCGICGEHGGDPSSIEFCHEIGLDYVSCSPYRVPIARLAAAQANIKNPRNVAAKKCCKKK